MPSDSTSAGSEDDFLFIKTTEQELSFPCFRQTFQLSESAAAKLGIFSTCNPITKVMLTSRFHCQQMFH